VKVRSVDEIWDKLLTLSSGLQPSLKRKVAISYETLELMYKATLRHISEGRDTDIDTDKRIDTRSLRNPTIAESLLHVIATRKQGQNFTSTIKTVTVPVIYNKCTGNKKMYRGNCCSDLWRQSSQCEKQNEGTWYNWLNSHSINTRECILWGKRHTNRPEGKEHTLSSVKFNSTAVCIDNLCPVRMLNNFTNY
jgi:hypothetical protein